MVSHIGSICEKCGSDKYEYIDKGFSKRGILATTCFTSAAIIISSLFIGVFLAAILLLITVIVGATSAIKANPKTVTRCNKCHSEDTMHFMGTPKGRELYKKYYEDK